MIPQIFVRTEFSRLPGGLGHVADSNSHQFSFRPDCNNTAEAPPFTLLTARSAIPFVSVLCGVYVQWFQERSSQALPNSKELSVLPGIFPGYALIAGGICIRNLSQQTECNRSPDNPQWRRICIFCGRWFYNIIRKRLRIPRTHSETGTHRKERESQRKISRHRKTSGLSKEISFIVIILNREVQLTCRKKNHSLFHGSTLMSSGQLIPIWT